MTARKRNLKRRAALDADEQAWLRGDRNCGFVQFMPWDELEALWEAYGNHEASKSSDVRFGLTEKNSVRAYVFRFALELGHCSMQSALRICARLQSRFPGNTRYGHSCKTRLSKGD
jgi:hypothetical protein